MNPNTVLTIFVAVTAVAFCLQLILLFLLYKAIEKSSERMEGIANRMEQRAAPVFATAHAILEEAQPRIGEITSNLAEASAVIRSQVAGVAQATGEIVERARMQAARLDDLVHSTADKVEQTTDFLQTSVITPVRRVHAILSAVNAGIGYLRRNRKKSPQLATAEDEEMFIWNGSTVHRPIPTVRQIFCFSIQISSRCSVSMNTVVSQEGFMRRLVMLFIMVVCIIAVAQERFDIKVREYFFSGYAGNSAALDKGMKICEEALSSNPKYPEAMVWHGSGLAYRSFGAFQAGDQQKGLELWRQGMQEMDAAVEMAPDNLGVRIPRGAFLLTSSRFMRDPDRARAVVQKGVSDLEKAYELQKDHLSQLGTHPRGELELGLADGYSRLGNQQKAAEWFERIKVDLKGTLYEDSANLWFQTKSLPANQAGCLGCHTGK